MSWSTASAMRSPPASRSTRSPKRCPMTAASWMHSRAVLVREWLQHELREVRARWLRLWRAGSEALGEQEQDRHARGARSEKPQQVQGRRVGEVQVFEDVEQRMLARERGDDVVHDDVHRALPFLRVARGLAHAGQMEELRQRC